MNIKQLALAFCCFSTIPLQGAGVTGTPNKFVTEYDSYLGSSHIFPTTLSIALFSGLFLTHLGSQKTRWYKRLENRARQEKRGLEEKKLRAKAKADFEKQEAERLKKDAELAAKLEEENKRRQAEEQAAQARRAEIAAKLENDVPEDGECAICLEDRPLYASCENLHRYCNDCLRIHHQSANGCSQCRAPYLISQRLRNLWGGNVNNNAAPAANPLDNVD